MISETIKELTSELITPLSDHTRRLFKPINICDFDRLHIHLSENEKEFIVEAKGISSKGEECYPSWQAMNWTTRVPEVSQAGPGKYRMACTDFTTIIINQLWPQSQLIMTKKAKIVFNYLLHRFMAQSIRAKQVADFKANGTVIKKWHEHPILPLAPHQRIGLNISMNQECTALFMDMGTGKTAIVIARICNEALYHKGIGVYRAIIVAPKNVRSNWEIEFTRFATTAGKIAVLRGGQLQRVKQLIEVNKKEDGYKYSVVVCSYETVIKSWDALRMIKWNLAVLDESHMIKSPSAARTKKMMELRELADQRMVLTGTPINNFLHDIFSQFEFLAEGMSGFKAVTNFKRYYGNWVRHGRFNALESYKNLPLVRERLARVAFQITKKEAMPDLPDKVSDICEIEMTPAQSRIYDDVRIKLAVEIKDDLGNVNQLTATHILTKLLRLSQITSGYVVFDKEEGEKSIIDRIDPNPKLEALIGLLQDKTEFDKSIVWTCWVQDIKSISARLTLEGIKHVTFYGGTSDKNRDAALISFNTDPECKVFLGNPGAGGVGINLLGYDVDSPTDHNANHVIYFAQNWSMSIRAQSEDRAHRRGTRVQVRYTDLNVPNSIDTEIRKRVLMKRQDAATIQDVKAILSRILDSKVVLV